MKQGRKIIVLLLLTALALSASACSRLFGPSNEEVIKAINDSGFFTDGSFTVAAPIVVLEKKRAKSGSWAVKISLTLALKTKDGKTATRVTNPLYTIHETKDAAGKTIWTATVGVQ